MPAPARNVKPGPLAQNFKNVDSSGNVVTPPAPNEVAQDNVVDEVKPLGFYDGDDEIAGLMLAQLVTNIGKFKMLQSQKAMGEGDTEKAIADFISSSPDPAAVAIRNQILDLQNQLRAFAVSKIKTERLSEDEMAKLDAKLESAKNKVVKGFEAIPNVAASSDQDVEGVMAVLRTIPNPTKSNRGRKPGTVAGPTGPKASAILTITGGGLTEPIVKPTFSAAALWLKCESKDLQMAFADAAGKPLDKISEVNTPQEFEFTSHNNGKTYHISTVAKDKAKPGRKPANAKGESAVATPAA